VHKNKAERFRLGWIVFIGLGILTLVEFWVATTVNGNVIPYLAVIALVKAGLVIQYFMHVAQLWHTEQLDKPIPEEE